MRGILVGLGARGSHWVHVCQQSDAVELVAFAEPIAERRERAKLQFGISDEQLFASLDDALNAVEADFVLDVTPPSAREAIAQMAFEHGLHVLAEKAMGEDWDMAKRIAKLAVSSECTYMVTQNYRFRPLPRTTRRLLNEGFLGQVNTVVVGFYRPWGMRAHYTEIAYALLIEMAVHHFDTLRYVLNCDPVRIWARTWNAPWGWHKGDVGHTVIFEFEDGIMVTHHALGCSVGKMSPWDGEWRIEGEYGSLTWEDGKLLYTRSHPQEQATHEALPMDALPLTDTHAVLAEFVTAVHEGREPECNPQDNLKTLAMVFGAILSAEEKRVVEIAELMA
ncbi:MAG TPA: Gfo/Idh/MocA family oxidoreductase [Armatimonadetes bacterium]|nr:Gfo/Idh/MocA family oxidoreductase [Armatimonadota bacterium]